MLKFNSSTINSLCTIESESMQRTKENGSDTNCWQFTEIRICAHTPVKNDLSQKEAILS